MQEYVQGEVYMADLPVRKSVVSGKRPVVIISHNKLNKRRQTVIVAPFSTIDLANTSPCQVKMFATKYKNLPRDSFVFVDHSQSIAKEQLNEFLFKLDQQDLELLQQAWMYCIKGYVERDTATPVAWIFEQGRTIAPEVDENREHEFKEYHPHPNNPYKSPLDMIKDKFGEYVCAFMNGEGGRVLYGISDDKVVTGVQLDAAERDELRRALGSMVRDNVAPKIDPSSIRINFHQVTQEGTPLQDVYVVEVITPEPPHRETLYFYKNYAYVKLDGQIEVLKGPAIQDWIIRRMRDGE